MWARSWNTKTRTRSSYRCGSSIPAFTAFARSSCGSTSGRSSRTPRRAKLYLTDMAAILNRHGQRVQALHLDDSSELLGINTRVELAEADRILRARKARELMLSGVTIERPETVTIDAQVRIGTDTIVEPFDAPAGQDRYRRGLPHRRGSDPRIGRTRGPGGDGALHSDSRFAHRSRRAGRPLRARAHAGPSGPGGAGRQLRRIEEDAARRGREEPASGLSGRFAKSGSA